MSLILELPPELETELAAEAARLRLPLADYIVRLLASGHIAKRTTRSGADVVAYWHSMGLVGAQPEIADALGYARALRQESEKREQQA